MTNLTQSLAVEWAPYDIRVNCLAPTAATAMTEGLMPAAVLEKLKPEAVSPGLLYLVSEEAPTRAILCAGAGSFERAYVTLTQGVHLGLADDTPERVAEQFDAISARDDETVPESGSAQGRIEIGKALQQG